MPTNGISTRSFGAALIALGFLLALPGIASAADLFVSNSGSNTSNCQSNANPCQTIQYAVNQSSSGDTINLASGTYSGAGNTEVLINRDVDLTFEGAGTNLTTIDGADTSNLFKFDTSSTAAIDATFRDLALVNGDGDTVFGSVGAAIQEEYWVTLSLTLTRVLVEGNTSNGDGGAIRSRKGSVTIHDSIFRDNQGFTGGAIKAKNVVISSLQSDPTTPTSLFVGNGATGAEGGAITANQVLASDVAFEDNSAASGDGGAINIGLDPPLEPTAIQLTGAVFEGNQARVGGAFRVSTDGAVEITESVFESNQATNTGGVMRVDSPGQVTVLRSTMAGNTAVNSYAVADMFSRDLSFVQSTVNANQATDPSGSYAIGAAREWSFTNSTITGNSVGPNGFALVYASNGDIQLRSTTSSDNTANSTFFFSSGGNLDVANSIINETGSFICAGIPPANIVNGGGNVLITGVSSDCDGLIGPSPSARVSSASLELGTLNDNGGPTKTIALGLGSSALRVAGSTTACPAEDQRGDPRPSSSCDSGAYELLSFPLAVVTSGTGSGKVTGIPSPAGATPIDCGSVCSGTFDEGTIVELTASAAPDSTFTGWGGACTGASPTCTTTVDQARSVSASFSLNPDPPAPTPTEPGLRISLGGAKKVRAGKAFRVGIRVTNTGSGPAQELLTCLKLPDTLFLIEAKAAQRSGQSLCWTTPSLGAGETSSFKASVRSSYSAQGPLGVRATTKASNASGGTVSAGGEEEVRVVKPRPKPQPKPPTG